MHEDDFQRLVDLYDRYANALDFDSAEVRSAEGEFYSLLEKTFRDERLQLPTLEYSTFRQAVILRCKRRILKGE